MKLQDYRDAFYTFSEKASVINRQLAFAGIAVIWLFKKDIKDLPTIPHQLFVPGFLLILSLTIDLLHACLGAAIWRWFYRTNEKREDVSEDDDLDHSVYLELPIWVLFVGKILLLVIAYIFLASFFIENITRN